MTIGFIGFGEAAYCISSGLQAQGVTDILAYDSMEHHPTMGNLIAQRAKETGVTLCGLEAVAKADVLFGAVPSSYALEVAKSVLPYLRKGQIYADVSASTPKVKQQIWALVKDTGILFADAAMLGSLPQDKHRVPITASGNGASAFQEAMTPYGMRITYVQGEAGAASAIKLMRSVFMKGLASLMVEMLQGADAYAVTGDVVASIAKSMDGIAFTQHLDRLVTGTAIHAVRRSAELKGSIEMLTECGLDSSMAKASKEKHDLLAAFDFQKRYINGKPAGAQEIITSLGVK
ncbi:MAG: DUF1932 domain-containing protein [Oscillospiraceae bacterium]|jgi:3-hydroxyisobutyrate dehydrogenase-like beta-hydroxyacid dehydrogenase|nr:DUF1932 domain-containing protein [Oscillospiraceae bacterium]